MSGTDQPRGSSPRVSVVVPTYDRETKLDRLLASIPDGGRYPVETIVVDGKPDGTLVGLDSRADRTSLVRMDEETFVAGARNAGWERARGEFVFFVDDDNVLAEGCIEKLASVLESREDLAVVAPLMLYHDDPGRIWCAGGRLNGSFTQPRHHLQGEPVETATTAIIADFDYFPNAYMVRNELPAHHDDRLFPHNWTEIDFCHRVKARGGGLATVTDARVFHDIPYSGKVTRITPWKIRDQARSRILFRRKHGDTRDHLLFWGFVFPVSTAYYGYRMVAEEASTRRLLGEYVIGSIQGLTTPINEERR